MYSGASEENKKQSNVQTPEVGIQRRMFPVEIRDIYKNDQGSADLQLIVTGINGKDYAVKTLADGNGCVPVTEPAAEGPRRRVRPYILQGRRAQ